MGFAAALLGFALMLVIGTALGLMFSVFNVLLRDFGRIVQTFINMPLFTAPMMYPYSLIDDRFGGAASAHRSTCRASVTEAVLLMQRGLYTTTDDTNVRRVVPAGPVVARLHHAGGGPGAPGRRPVGRDLHRRRRRSPVRETRTRKKKIMASCRARRPATPSPRSRTSPSRCRRSVDRADGPQRLRQEHLLKLICGVMRPDQARC